MRFLSSAVFALTMMLALVPARAQQADCTPGRDLITIPEIKSDQGLLQGVITLSDEQRSMAGAATGTPCQPQRLRFFKGYSTLEAEKPWPSTGDPIPGPTLRARVGDLVQLTFLNHVNPRNFPNTLDQGEQGKTDACDEARAQRTLTGKSAMFYPRIEANPSAPADAYPNCMHGSSTANIHFHGTHTTPSTTGDNVLLYIRPALRQGDQIEPNTPFVQEQFADFFKRCKEDGPPHHWEQMPPAWQAKQRELLETYDTTAPYKGVAGALPAAMRLWPKNEENLKKGLWPQYSIGAFPYCFSLPAYDPKKVKMGQAPGTHWYHAHKHGSTALNVGNGMTGAFVIEGAYDDALRTFYKATPKHKNWGLREQVLVIQQLETSLNVLSPTNKGGPAPLSVNGRLNPVVTMKPNQVQMWRLINTAPRTFVQLDSFTQRGGGQSPAWRQIAQDGVQLSYTNYQRIGTLNAKINLATANRADLLVRAPAFEGEYELKIVESVEDLPTGTPTTLLTVRVEADDEKKIDPPMDFIENEQDFPKLPEFLADITGPFYTKRELYFNTDPRSDRSKVGHMPAHKINGKLFDGHHVDQKMYLDTAEEWTLFNQTTNIAHPFHIHINPFQIVEVFQPNTTAAADKNSPCYADPLKPESWKPCQKLEPPFVWWDVFAIPTARQDALPASVCTELAGCPADIQQYTACTKGTCTVTIPGYFKMRSRFVDFTGQFVLHCHILAHEDRGMMQLVEVAPKPETQFEHH